MQSTHTGGMTLQGLVAPCVAVMLIVRISVQAYVRQLVSVLQLSLI
jgi:hypothetical protein